MELKKYPTQTREQWLASVALGMAPKFKQLGSPLPRVRLTMSLTKRRKAIGVCYDPSCSADGTAEILVRLDRFEPVEVAAILAHELCHAAVGVREGHKGKFKTLALAIGLEGKMTATVPGERFKAWVAGVLGAVGPFPHAALNFMGERSGPKPQKGRMLKAECSDCGYIVRLTRVWVEKSGAPLCPCNHEEMKVEGEEE